MPLQKKTRAKEKLDKVNSNKRILRTRVIEKTSERTKKILSSKKKLNNKNTNKQQLDENEGNKKSKVIPVRKEEEELVQKSLSSSYSLRRHSEIRVSKTTKRKDKKSANSNTNSSEEDSSDNNSEDDDDEEEGVSTRSKKTKSIKVNKKNPQKTKKVQQQQQQQSSKKKKAKIIKEKEEESDSDDDNEQKSVSSEDIKKKRKNNATTTTTNRESNTIKTNRATRNSKSHQQKEQILRKDQKKEQWKCEKCRQTYGTESGYYNHIPLCPSYSSSSSSTCSSNSDSEYPPHGVHEEEDDSLTNLSDFGIKGSNRPEYEESVIFSDDDDELKEILNTKVDSSSTITTTTSTSNQKENYDDKKNNIIITTAILTNENKQPKNNCSIPNIININTTVKDESALLVEPSNKIEKTFNEPLIKTNDNNNDDQKNVFNNNNNSNTTNKPMKNPLVASVERFFSSTINTTNNNNMVSSSASTIISSTSTPTVSMNFPKKNDNNNDILGIDKFVKQRSLISLQSSSNTCSSINSNVADTVTSTKCAKSSNSGSLIKKNPNIIVSSKSSKEIKTHKKLINQVESQSSLKNPHELTSHSIQTVLKLEEKKKGKNKKSKSEINSSSSLRNTKDKMVKKMKSTSCQSTGTDTGNSIILLPSKISSSIGTSTSMGNNKNFTSNVSSTDPYQNIGTKTSNTSNSSRENISKHTDYYFHQGQQTEQLKMQNNANNIHQQLHHVHNSSIHLQGNTINPSLNEMTAVTHHPRQQHHNMPSSHGLLSPQPHYPSSSSILSPYSSPSLSSSTTGSIKTNTPYTSPHISSPNNNNHRNNNESFSDAFNQLVSNSPKLNLQKSLLSPQQQHHNLPINNPSNVNNYEGETITLQDDSGQIHQIPVPSIQQQLQQSAATAAASAHLQRIVAQQQQQNYNPYASLPYLNNLNWSLQQQALMQQQQQHHHPLGFVTGLHNLQQQQLIQQSLIGLPTQTNFTMMQQQQQQQQQFHHNQYPIVSSHVHVNTMALQQPTYIDQPLSSSSASINHNNSPYLILQPGTTNNNQHHHHHQFSTISNRYHQPTSIYNISNNGLPSSLLPSDTQKLFTQQHHTTNNMAHYFPNHHLESSSSSLFDTKSIPLPSIPVIPGSGISIQQQPDHMNNSLFLAPQNPITSNLHTSPSKISMPNSHNHFKTSNLSGAGVAQPCPCDLCLEKIRIGGETQSKLATESTHVTQNKLQQHYNKKSWNNSSSSLQPPPPPPSSSKYSSSSSSVIENKKSHGKSSKKQSSRSSNNGTTNLKKILPALKSTATSTTTTTEPFQAQKVSFSSKHVSLTVPIEEEVKNNDNNNSSVGTPITNTTIHNTNTNISVTNNTSSNNNNIAVVRPLEHPLQKLAEKFGDSTVSPSPIKLSLPSNNNIGDNKDTNIGSKLFEEDNQRKHNINSSYHNISSETHLINTTSGDDDKSHHKDKLIVGQPRKSKLNDSESDSSTAVPVKRRKHSKDKMIPPHNEDSQINKGGKDGKSKIKITLKRREGGSAYSIGDVTTGTIDTKGTIMRSLKIKAKVTNGQGQGLSSDVVVVPVIHTIPIPFQVGSNRTIPGEGKEDSINIMDPLVLKKKKKDPEENEGDASESSKKTHRVVVVYEVKHGENTIFRSSNVHSIWDYIFETVQGQKTFQSSFHQPLSYPGTNISLDENSDVVAASDYNSLGLTHRAVQFLLSQLPSRGASSKLSTTKSKKKQAGSNESDVPVVRCARIRGYQGRKPFDMFGWLASKHRTLPTIEGPNDNGKAIDLPVALRYKPLKREKSCLLGVYFSTIHGRGLFTRRDIEQGEVIIEYAGEIIRSILCDIREKHYESKGYGCYFFTIDDNLVVDATIHGNAARFINHSCDPNCRSKIDYVQGKKRILIVSLRKILGGEELTYDYKFAKEEKEKKIPCHCGTKKCRKYLN